MGNLLQQVRHPPGGRIDTFCNGITKQRLLIASFAFLGLLSFSLLITVIAQGRKNGQNESNTDTTTSPSPSPINYKLCITPGCVSAATHQLRAIDNTASSNLCTDFYTYACGGWQKTHPIQSFDVERTILSDIIDRRDMEIEILLDAPISRMDPQAWEYKLKTYYSECRDDYARVTTSGTYMIALIKDANTIDGWFIFDNSAENVSQVALLKNQTIYKQLSHIHGDLGALAVFGIRTKLDENDPSIKRLEFFPAGISMEINDYFGMDSISELRRTAFQSYIMEVLGLLAREAGVTDSNLSDRMFTVANDAFTIERYLADILQNNSNNNVPITKNLQNMSAEYSFDFDRYMAHALDDPSVISILTPVYVTNPAYFTEAFTLLKRDNDPLFARMIHNYFRWRLIWTYIEDLSYDYVHAHRAFLNAYYGYAVHASNEDYCTREIVRRFPLAIQRLYTMDPTRHVNTTTTIQTIFDSLKQGFKQYINEKATWMPDEETKNVAREKIDALTAAIGYTSIASNDASLDSYYDKFAVGDESHLQNAYNYHRFHRWTLSNSLKNPNALDHWDLFETRTSRLFDYIALVNRLFVIASGMQEPIVNSEWPWPVNMGSIGVLLAQKLFSSIDGPDGRSHLPNGTRFNWWKSPTINGYNISRNCITDYYVRDLKTLTYNINGVQLNVQLAGEPFSPITLRHIGALRFAYETVMKNDEITSFKMPGTNLTGQQTFFLAYAQTQCYQRQELLQLLRTQLGSYDERTALNAALIHMPEFAQAFQCQPRQNQCFD